MPLRLRLLSGHKLNLMKKPTRGTLADNEPHPAAYEAKDWIASLPPVELLQWREAFASCSISGNRLAEICGETLGRLMSGQPVSDRYVLVQVDFLKKSSFAILKMVNQVLVVPKF